MRPRKERVDSVDKKKAAAATMATVITASGAAVDASFDGPADLLQDMQQEPHIEYVDLGDDADGEQAQDDEKGRASVRPGVRSLREKVLELPLVVRLLFVLPLWAVGHVAVMAGSALFTALSPLLSGLMNFLLVALVLLVAFVCAAKLMFPDLPLGRILTRRTIKGVLVAAVMVFAVDFLLPIIWPAYTRWKVLVLGLCSLTALLLLAWRFGRREERRRAAERETQREADEEELLIVSSGGKSFTMRAPKREP